MTMMPRRSTDDRPTRIALLAVSQRDRAILELMIERFLAREFVISPRDQADMALIDGDAESGRNAVSDWQHLRPAAALVILTLRPQPNGNGLAYVAKPIDVATLIEAMRGLRTWSGGSTTLARPARSAPQPKESPALAPLQFPRPILIPSRQAFVPFRSSAGEGFGNMVSVEICMSSDPEVCLAADHSTTRQSSRWATAASVGA
jgi:hypothetical protein